MSEIDLESVLHLDKLIIDHIPDGIFMVNLWDEVVIWNQAMAQLTGIGPDEAVGNKHYLLNTPLLETRPGLVDLVLGSSSVLNRFYYNLAIENGVYHADLRLKPKRMVKARWYSLRAIPLHDQGNNLKGVICTIVDTGNDKMVAETRRENELQFLTTAENLEDMLYRVDFKPVYHFKYLSPILGKVIGVDPEFLYADFYRVLNYVHPDDRKLLMSIFYGREPKSVLLRWLRPDGRMGWHEHRVVPIVDSDGNKIGLNGIVRDLTDRIHIEEELRGANEQLEASFQQLSCLEEELRQQYDELETTQVRLATSERRYRTLLENVNLIALMLDQNGRIIFVNDYSTTLTGWQHRELLGCNFTDILVADSQRRKWAEHFTDTITSSRESKYFSLPLESRDGTTHIINFSQTLLYDTRDQVEGIALIGEDVTERETVRQALVKSERHFREIMESLVDLISKTDTNGQVIYVSPSHQLVFGIDPETMKAMDLDDFIHPEDIISVKAALRQVLRLGKVTSFESRCRHFSKGYLWVETVATPLFDNDTITGAVLSSRNITERKWLEDELRYVGLHDVLTGLYNRTYFEEEMKRLSDGRSDPVGVFVIDVDGLKLVNDSLGHEKGDLLLYRAADVIKKAFRHGDVVARVGGDEFAVLLPRCELQLIERIRERLQKTISEYNEHYPELPLSISVGTSMLKQTGQAIRELYKEADNDMYRDKLQRSHSARSALVQTLMTALEARDYITEGHAERLQTLVSALSSYLGLPSRVIGEMKLLAQFHDIGKVGIPDRILFKPEALTPEEFAEMKRHSEIGCRIALASPALAPLSDLILKHHEWWNGKGYPLGIEGEEIPLPCRILAVADAFDAMTNDRPYRTAMAIDVALIELEAGAGTQFDPALVQAFCEIVRTNHLGL